MDDRDITRCIRERADRRRTADERVVAERTGDECVVRRHERDLVGLCREAKRGGITRRQFIERALVLGLSATAVGAFASACGDEAPSPAPSTPGIEPMDETRPAEILFCNWIDYIDPAILRRFKQEADIHVELYQDYGGEVLAKLKAGAKGFDVVGASDYMVSIMRASDLLEPLDMSYLPNFRHVSELLRTPSFDDPAAQGGLRYSVPYFYGVTGYCQRLDKVAEPQTSWDALWDKRHEGEINLLDDEREVMGMALKRRGYSINTTTQTELDEATADLIEQKPLVATYDSVNIKRAIVRGQSFVMCWDGDVRAAMRSLGGGDDQEKGPLHWVVPEEGCSRWADQLVVTAGRNSRYGAHLFMDFLMRPDVAGQNASFIRYLSPIAPASWEFTDPEALLLRPTDEELARSELFDDVGELATAYSEAWRQVKSA